MAEQQLVLMEAEVQNNGSVMRVQLKQSRESSFMNHKAGWWKNIQALLIRLLLDM